MLSIADSPWLAPHEKLDGVALIDHLFNRMDGLYPGRWRTNFRDDNAISNWRESWAEAFDEESITPRDVAVGIKNCRRLYEWPPSLTEFLRACRPMLDSQVAFHEAVAGLAARRKGDMGHWSHPAIYYAAVAIGQQEMLGSTYGQLKSRWDLTLSEQLARGSWEPIPEPTPALPAPTKTEMSDKEARKAMERLGVEDVLDQPKRDPKAWARKILDNTKERTPAVIEMARRALEEN